MASAPAATATLAVSSEQLSAITTTLSPAFICGKTEAMVAVMPAASLCAGINTATLQAGLSLTVTVRFGKYAQSTCTNKTSTGTNKITSITCSKTV